jgi:hypothetical protein
MPNWMRTALEVSGDKTQREEFFNAIGQGLESDQPIDFEKIIPPPDNLFRGNLGQPEEKYCKDNNIPDWYSWNTKNWGTKWNAAYGEVKTFGTYSNVLFFDTAWNLALPILEEIERMLIHDYKGLEVYGEFVEEGYSQAGFIKMDKNGGHINEVTIEMDEDNNYSVRYFNEDGIQVKFKHL